MLLLEAGMIGVFVALDLFLFYIFWEAMLIPMYFLIGIWGHERRIYAAVKFFLYTMAGSVLMLVAFLVLYRRAGCAHLRHPGPGRSARSTPRLQMWLFAAFALAFAIKVPMFPFHTWLPDAHVEAPTAGSVILAGVMLKMGGYGFLRLAIPLFPDAAARVRALDRRPGRDRHRLRRAGLAGAARPQEAGRLLVGLPPRLRDARHRRPSPPPRVVGAVYQMLNHGISTGALFLMVGMLYDRRHTRQIAEFGGLKAVMPWFSALFLLDHASPRSRCPGFNGFVGEFLILMGSWRFSPTPGGRWPRLGVILAAAYILWMVQRVFYGEVTEPAERGAARPVRARGVGARCRWSCWPSSWAWPARCSRARSSPRWTRWCAQRAHERLRAAPVAAATRAARGGGAADERHARPPARSSPPLIVAVTGLVVLLAQAFTPKGEPRAVGRAVAGRPRRRRWPRWS